MELCMFKQNVGALDRGLRLVLGLGLLSYAAVGTGPARWFGLIGLVPLLTGALGSCPLYAIFGISTCSRTETPVR